jgi:hypothetical protein
MLKIAYAPAMRVLEALRILETATVECKLRPINTPEVREAIDLLEPYCKPDWFVRGFRSCLEAHFGSAPCKTAQAVRASSKICE